MKNDVKFPLLGLLVNETSKTVQVRAGSADWSETLKKIVDGNLLDKSRSLSAKRYVREIQLRAGAAYEWELDSLAGDEDSSVKTLICYLMCVRTYNLVSDFFNEVILRKLQQQEYRIEDYEVRSFIESKAQVYPRLNQITESTESRLRSYLLKIFREAGIIASARTREITPVDVPAEVIDLYKSNGAGHELRYIILDK
jgi:hypothetical protein